MNARSKTFRKGSAAFTLLEVMLAIVILTAAILAIMEGFARSLNAIQSIQNYSKARELFSIKLAELDQLEEFEDGYEEGDFEEVQPGFTWSMEISPTDYIDLHLVRITVSWTEQGQAASETIETYTYQQSDETRQLRQVTRRAGENR